MNVKNETTTSYRYRAELPPEAITDPREEILIRYGLGKDGVLRSDRMGITFSVDMHKLDGEPDGHVIITSETIVEDPAKLFVRPQNPTVMLADPNPVEHIPTESFGKAIWTFPDGSSLTALGGGTSIIVKLKGGDVLTTEALSMVITNGTARYEGADGLWTANRTLANPPGGSLIGSSGDFTQKQIHVIRVTRGRHIDKPSDAE